ncbi:MAG: formate dehydrogenase accessory protein FdhE [Desulfurococcales archaeon]|nr:formate dehydrogenase accessory protein FdhE [Desulfurococcales archaeon]
MAGRLEELEEFRRALDKYGHLVRIREFDPETALVIEEAQLRIIEDIGRGLEDKGTGSLEELLDSLVESGTLYRYVDMIADAIGEKVEDPEGALRAVIRGEEGVPGFRSVFLALQAVARAYALLLLKEGPVEEPSSKCPACGIRSETMVKRGDDYHMVCHFCSYEWVASRGRMMCPYCGTTDPIAIGLYSDKKRRLGLAHCQECGSTWRCVLDETIKAPRQLLPLIALGAEVYRRFLEDRPSL